MMLRMSAPPLLRHVRRALDRTRTWRIRELPPAAKRNVIAVDVTFVAVIVLSAVGLTLRSSDLATFAACGVLGWIARQLAPRLGAFRRRTDEPQRDLLSAWTLPVALLLPPFYAAVLHLPLYLFNGTRRADLPPHKQVFNAAALGLSGFCASVTHGVLNPVHGTYTIDSFAGTPAQVTSLFVSAVVYNFVNRILVLGVLRHVAPASARKSLGPNLETFAVDTAEMCSGIVVAVLWIVSPLLMVAAVPPVIMLQRSILHAELLHAARTDAKTRLANPAHWREVAEREVLRARRSGSPVSVLLVDIDHFKIVNDRHGHLVGDEVLLAVADVLRESARMADLVGRFGGEEFVVLLSGVDLDGAARAAERIRFGVAATRCPVAGLGSVAVTVSVGVATTSGAMTGLAELMENADAALYRAKADGRNLVRLASQVPAQRPA